MVIGKIEMYIIIMYRIGIVGCRFESGILENLVVCVEVDWKRLLMIWILVGRLVMIVVLIYFDISFENLSLELKVLIYVEDNEVD